MDKIRPGEKVNHMLPVMALRSLKLLGGQSEVQKGTRRASEKGHLLAKRALFSTITVGSCPHMVLDGLSEMMIRFN